MIENYGCYDEKIHEYLWLENLNDHFLITKEDLNVFDNNYGLNDQISGFSSTCQVFECCLNCN